MDDFEEEIKGFDLSQPVLFTHSPAATRVPEIRDVRSNTGTATATPVPLRKFTFDSAAQKQTMLTGTRSALRSTPTLPEREARARDNERSAQRFYFQLLEYFVFLLMKFKSLETADNKTQEAQKYEELAKKIVAQTNERLRSLVFAPGINHRRHRR